ncbi:MAG: polymerase [Phycisphaerales bacterium]|nr:polymerase [Phycisphaerales bacterium]
MVLVQSTASRLTVAFACDLSASAGVRPGITLAEARAICSGLIWFDHDATEDAKSLHRLAQWMIRFSPAVAVEGTDAILLDVTGSERLFGGFERLTRLVVTGLTGLGFSVHVATAPTLGAAWAIASFGESGAIISQDGLRKSLDPLPIAALRLSDEVIAALQALGIRRIDQLLNLPRRALPARFGTSVLTRLDQALGLVDEPLVLVRRRQQIRATLEFETSVESLEMLWEALKRVLTSVSTELREQCRGAKRLALDLTASKARFIRKEIHLSRASANSSVLFNLLRCASETVNSDTGFIALTLTVLASEPLTPEQLCIFGEESRAAEMEFGHLMERLRIRLGAGAVLTADLAASHLPERAFRLSDATETVLTPHKNRAEGRKLKSRPLHLLPKPAEIHCTVAPSVLGAGEPLIFTYNGTAYRIVQASGPERISGVWWEGRNKTRDYFDVEEEAGRRFWIFRVAETRRWFLHGVFDC